MRQLENLKRTFHIRSILLGVLVMVHLSSCNDWLELVPPDGLVRNEYWTSKEDIEAVLMGAYQKFAQLDERLFLFGELRADMVADAKRTGLDERRIMEGNIYPDNQECNWRDFYLVINYCNSVLKYTSEVYGSDQTFTEYQKDGFEAEAIYLRSLAYFYLVRIFKDVPLVLEASEEDDVEFYLPKSADTLILKQIETDLENYRNKVTGVYPSLEQNKGRATKGAFLALLADISLWNFEYDDVIKYVNLIESESEYLLLHGGNWFENYYPGNSLESIFEFQFDKGLGQVNTLWDYTYYEEEKYLASSKALELLTMDASSETIRALGSISSKDAAIWKYCGAAPDERTYRSILERTSANWIVYRYADVLLMKAEALSQTGRYAEALELLNQVRTRALMLPLSVSETPEAFENAILEERAVEFAFEGKRWFDLMRMGRRNDFRRKKDLIQIIVEKVPSTQKLVLASKLTDPNGWYMPIEELEIERNNNLVQNPYYAAYMSD